MYVLILLFSSFLVFIPHLCSTHLFCALSLFFWTQNQTLFGGNHLSPLSDQVVQVKQTLWPQELNTCFRPKLIQEWDMAN